MRGDDDDPLLPISRHAVLGLLGQWKQEMTEQGNWSFRYRLLTAVSTQGIGQDALEACMSALAETDPTRPQRELAPYGLQFSIEEGITRIPVSPDLIWTRRVPDDSPSFSPPPFESQSQSAPWTDSGAGSYVALSPIRINEALADHPQRRRRRSLFPGRKAYRVTRLGPSRGFRVRHLHCDRFGLLNLERRRPANRLRRGTSYGRLGGTRRCARREVGVKHHLHRVGTPI